MKNIKYKYSEEYDNFQGLFWEAKPAKYVLRIAEVFNSDLKGLNVLDLGAGEGKNAVYLAFLGAKVTAVDASKTALNRFSLQPRYGKLGQIDHHAPDQTDHLTPVQIDHPKSVQIDHLISV